jgi:hypothetical protein
MRNTPAFNQASKILARFGGPTKFALALGVNRSTAYRLLYPAPAGSDGLVPHQMVGRIRAAAERLGIWLDADDWNPEPTSPAQQDKEPTK